MKELKLQDIVLKLIGNVNPAGCASRDPERLENLKVLCELTEILIDEIAYVSRSKDSYESSVKEAGQYAQNFLLNQGL